MDEYNDAKEQNIPCNPFIIIETLSSVILKVKDVYIYCW